MLPQPARVVETLVAHTPVLSSYLGAHLSQPGPSLTQRSSVLKRRGSNVSNLSNQEWERPWPNPSGGHGEESTPGGRALKPARSFPEARGHRPSKLPRSIPVTGRIGEMPGQEVAPSQDRLQKGTRHGPWPKKRPHPTQEGPSQSNDSFHFSLLQLGTAQPPEPDGRVTGEGDPRRDDRDDDEERAGGQDAGTSGRQLSPFHLCSSSAEHTTELGQRVARSPRWRGLIDVPFCTFGYFWAFICMSAPLSLPSAFPADSPLLADTCVFTRSEESNPIQSHPSRPSHSTYIFPGSDLVKSPHRIQTVLIRTLLL